MGLCRQPSVIRDLSNTPGFRRRGLCARFRYAIPVSSVGQRSLDGPPMPAVVGTPYHEAVTALLDQPRRLPDAKPFVRELAMSQEAFGLWTAFSREVKRDMADGGRFEAIREWAPKLPGAAARIAAVLHCARRAFGSPQEHPVASADMRAASRMAEAPTHHALIAFDLMRTDPAIEGARTILRWLGRVGQPIFTRRDYHAKNQRHLARAADLDKPLEILAERGYVRQVPQPVSPKGGRPSTVLQVDPRVLSQGRALFAA